MFYCCNHCRYIFSADALPEQCPDCGEQSVRPATEEERSEHLRLLKVVENDNWDDTAERVGAQCLTSSR